MAEQQTAKTLHDIASLIRTPEQQEQPAEVADTQLPPDEGKDVEDQAEEGEVEEAEEDPVEDSDEEHLGAENDTSEEGEDEEEDAGDDDADADTVNDDFIDVRDDDMIEVKIDGEVQLRSIADAKKALSGEGAIDKRLKEATEARKQAQADHTMLLEQFSVAHNNLMKTVGGMEDIVFQPQVKKPDPSLRQSDPQKYLLQVDAYEADQRRVQEGKQAIKDLVKQQQEALQEDIGKYRQEQSNRLLEAIPELGDQEVAPKLLQGMSKLAVEKYGYSPEEIQQASDHRLYRMMHDLMKFHEARESRASRKTDTVKNLEGQERKRPRKLRSGATKLKSQARKQAEANKQATEQARQSGKVKDVAATLIRTKG